MSQVRASEPRRYRHSCGTVPFLRLLVSMERYFKHLIATMSAMEVDGAAAPVELPCLSLDVLAIVKDAQGLHGLKHSDYQRYRWVPKGGWARLECSRR